MASKSIELEQTPVGERNTEEQQEDSLNSALVSTESQQPASEFARADTGPPYSIFKPWQKKLIVFAASFGAVFSPMSTTIYLPALNSIASELHVSNADINLTVTTFLVCCIIFKAK